MGIDFWQLRGLNDIDGGKGFCGNSQYWLVIATPAQKKKSRREIKENKKMAKLQWISD